MKIRLTHCFYICIQLTWGSIQNFLGFILWLLLLIKDPKRQKRYYHGAIVTNWKLRGSMGLGMFIFFGHSHESVQYQSEILVHEFGHTIQSCILGPLFLPVIGIPSLIWANAPRFVKGRQEKKYAYFDFYPEKWANYEGERVLKQSAPHQRIADRLEKR